MPPPRPNTTAARPEKPAALRHRPSPSPSPPPPERITARLGVHHGAQAVSAKNAGPGQEGHDGGVIQLPLLKQRIGHTLDRRPNPRLVEELHHLGLGLAHQRTCVRRCDVGVPSSPFASIWFVGANDVPHNLFNALLGPIPSQRSKRLTWSCTTGLAAVVSSAITYRQG
jgi:hypothetical protein